ncbi:MAG: DUF493 family protein [Bdellovibrionales bacterium]|nr:DUF493 family protein [Bdellovibrionales bacterium]
MDNNFLNLLQTEHTWPGVYEFRFVIPASSFSSLRDVFSKELYDIKPSAKGNYMRFSCRMHLSSAEEVIAKYEEVRHIEGLISL